MKKGYYFFSLMLTFSIATAQEDFMLSEISVTEFTQQGSDVWGYVDADGIEYAIVGDNTGTRIYSLADHANPALITRIPGVSSTWRDIKIYENFLYIVADREDDGLLIVDMIDPQNPVHKFWKPDLSFTVDGVSNTATLERCHNAYIDEASGFLYLVGCQNPLPRGMLIFDLNNDPWNPVYVNWAYNGYTHDLYVRNDTAYTADLSGGFGVFDLKDKLNPIELARINTTSNFTHNIWLSDDGDYAFTTDETGFAFIDAYDISDLTNIELLDTYRPEETKEEGVIPHNVFYYKGYLVMSYYTDGIKIIDARKPENMVEVGAYDTYLGASGGFAGCWGAYPYLPSENILASNLSGPSGLFVLGPTYQRASYLEGVVTDAQNGDPIIAASITITGARPNSSSSDGTGEYRTGLGAAGTYMVHYSHPYYFAQTHEVDISTAMTTIKDVQLQRKPESEITFVCVDEATSAGIEDVQILISNDTINYSLQTDANGIVTEKILDENFDVLVAGWGHRHESKFNTNYTGKDTIWFEMEEGYQDHFFADLGWRTRNTATVNGHWERSDPFALYRGNGDQTTPDDDIDYDLGNFAYITGNQFGTATQSDVDNGYVELSSPSMDLSGYTNPVMRYNMWFYNNGNNNNDTLNVYLNIADTNMILIDQYTFLDNTAEWSDLILKFPLDYTTDLDNVQLVLYAEDKQGEGDVLEVCFDNFDVVEEADILGTEDILYTEISIEAFPNPFQNSISVNYQIDNFKNAATLKIFNAVGTLVETQTIKQKNGILFAGAELPSGIYFMHIESQSKIGVSQKIIKID